MKDCLLKEVEYRTSRASGPGGQHVNKTESRVELYWDLGASLCLDETQKNRVRQLLSSRLTTQDVLIISCDRFRSQHRNREEVTDRFVQLLCTSLSVPKKRHPTKPTRSSREKRIRTKKLRGEIKRLRQKPNPGRK
jgi:ribosome-associated protein